MALVEAVCANIMRGSGSAFLLLQHISKRSRFKFVQFVSLLLGFPFFHISNLAFQILYTFRQRKLIRLSVQSARLRGNDSVVKFDDLFLQKGSVTQTYSRLRYILRRFDAANRTLNSDKINHVSPVSSSRVSAGSAWPFV